MDLLGHVNNVTYIDYLQEARVDMMRIHAPDSRADDLAEGVVVVGHRVTYLSPLTFRFRPVLIECWITEIRAASFTMAYEVFDEHDGLRTTYLRATSVLSPFVFAEERPRRLTDSERDALTPFLEPAPPPVRPGWPDGRRDEIGHYPVHVRFSDVDIYRHVNNVMYFEYFQEGRISLTSRLTSQLPPGTPLVQVVVAQTDVDYKRPIVFRQDPYDLWSWVHDVGRTSLTLRAEILDGDRLLARAQVVMVCWDPQTGRAAEPPAAYRELLLAAREATPGR